MLPFYQSFIERLNALHTNIIQAIDDLPQEALDWKPSAAMNSIAVLIVHLTGAERYWIGDVAGSDSSGRDRAAEFRVSGITYEALHQRLVDSSAYAQNIIRQFTLPDLEQERISPRDGRKLTVAWALLHVLEHTAIHLGHIQLTRQLWGQKKQ